ncbi:NUDIX domain-containing protein [Ruania alkalisoli]|uniref:NUDIX domain-containing protein n=1 Tax=Ruania alkalisoli TaxID=2779775 RepID=A0A7M1SUX3_9MICO|nr:NUDIX domain-containing protein [Ruania alkalisoli]QOR71335.1 NUDIX domain-containing protein [Ruania alkalisoli]
MPVPDFVLELRRHVGTAHLWLSGVSAVVFDANDRILLGRRADTGRWAVISGILDPGEQPAVAAIREVAEETGIRVEVDALVSALSGDEITYPNGDRASYLDLTFRCRYLDGAAHVADDESLEVAWFPSDVLPEDLQETSRQRIADALAYDPATGPRFIR